MRRDLFGTYVPTGGWVERLPLGARYALVVALGAPAVIWQRWSVTLVAVGVAAVMLITARVGVRRGLALGPGVIVVLGVVAVVHVLQGTLPTGVQVCATLVLALYATRLLTLTTSVPVLVEGLARVARLLRPLGVRPDRLALAVGVMLRSVPVLLGVLDEVRNAGRARGLRRQPFALVAPAVVRSVAYAQVTGDALAARGLGDEDD